jgi:ParB-like chromosome segregation protein Spo0J
MSSTNTKKIVKWKLNKLKNNPKQCLLFIEPTPQEIAQLAADMQKNGQLQAVEILPDGTLIAGHKRAKAAAQLGWTELDAWVRDDIAAQGEDAVERRLIEDNLSRRQLDPLDRARCALRLKNLARNRWQKRLSDSEKGEVREQIGLAIGRSGRQVDRLLRVVEHTPIEIQGAVSGGRLSMNEALTVAGLDQALRKQIAEAIRTGADAKETVRHFVVKKDSRHKTARDAKKAFIKLLARGHADLDGRVEEVVDYVSPADQQALTHVRDLIDTIVKKAKSRSKIKTSKPISSLPPR